MMCLQSKGVWVYDHYMPAEMTLAYPHVTLLTMAPYGKPSLVPGTYHILECTLDLILVLCPLRPAYDVSVDEWLTAFAES